MKITLTTALKNLSRTELDDTKKIGQLVKKLR